MRLRSVTGQAAWRSRIQVGQPGSTAGWLTWLPQRGLHQGDHFSLAVLPLGELMPVVNGSWCCGNEPSIKIYEADEALEVVNISRLWEPPKSLEVSGSALFLEILWPKIHSGLSEGALAEV